MILRNKFYSRRSKTNKEVVWVSNYSCVELAERKIQSDKQKLIIFSPLDFILGGGKIKIWAMSLSDSKPKHFNFILGNFGKAKKWKLRDRLSKHPQKQTKEETVPHFLPKDINLQHA